MLSFFRKSKVLLGLDIGASSVKLLELSSTDGAYRLENYAIVPLSDDAIVDKEVKKPEDVAEAIRAGMQQLNTRLKMAAIAMPNTLVITKVIQIDAELNHKELEAQIQLDASRYIPYPLEEVSYDFVNLGVSRKDNAKNDVLLAASRTEQMDSRVDAVQDAGIVVRVVDIESYALERSFKLILKQLAITEEDSDKLVAIVDIGATTTSITILQNMNIIYMRDESFGGRQLTEEIKSRFELTNEQAEYAKRSGSLPTEYATEVLEPYLESLAVQISRSLQFFYSSTNTSHVDHIVLSGGTATVPQLASFVQRNSSVNTIVANPFLDMKVSSKINPKKLEQDASGLMVACGLALRSFIS